MTHSLQRPIASTKRDSTTRVAWLAHRNAHLTRQNGALQDQNQQLLQVLAGVALVAGNMHPDVAREIVAIVEEVTLTEPDTTALEAAERPETGATLSDKQKGLPVVPSESQRSSGSVSVIPAKLNELLGGP